MPEEVQLGVWGEFETEEEFWSSDTKTKELSMYLGCNATTVGRCFSKFHKPQDFTRAQLNTTSETLDTLKQLERHLKSSVKLLSKVPDIERASVMSDASMSGDELAKLYQAVKDWRLFLDGYYRRESRVGGREPASHIVLDALFEIFRQLGREVKFGHDSEVPNTEFGKAVQKAFKVFGVDTDWRDVTQNFLKGVR